MSFDALIIGGGADVNPQLYHDTLAEQLSKARRWSEVKPFKLIHALFITLFRRLFLPFTPVRGVDHARDRLEYYAIRKASEAGLPMLGICRGAQLLNVFYGGSLFQSIQDFYTETPMVTSILPRKTVLVEDASLLRSIVGIGKLRINSLHRQSIKNIGRGLKVTAKEHNGVIQAVERRGDASKNAGEAIPASDVIGVQWHPEFLPYQPEQRRIFAWLVAAARKRASSQSLEPDALMSAKNWGPRLAELFGVQDSAKS